ncbi:MAG TPA: hypothetical protein VL634_15035 [Mycobacterium sp.]|jgi:hypothetical protein|nr:hypothetical protein [Mycobacterium sp.]
MMKRTFVGLATTVLVSGGVGAVGLGLAGTAQACNGEWGPCGYGPNRWCPGDSLYMDRGGPYQLVEWDMNVCHTWYRVAEGAGNVPEGPNNASDVWEGDNPPPPAAPPAPPPPGLPPPPGMCWAMWIPAPCPNG